MFLVRNRLEEKTCHNWLVKNLTWFQEKKVSGYLPLTWKNLLGMELMMPMRKKSNDNCRPQKLSHFCESEIQKLK